MGIKKKLIVKRYLVKIFIWICKKFKSNLSNVLIGIEKNIILFYLMLILIRNG